MSIEKFLLRLDSEINIAQEGINIDNLLIVFEKPIQLLLNKNITLYHGSPEKFNIIKPQGVNVGAIRKSDPRWSSYCWDDKNIAISWALFQMARKKIKTIWNSIYNKPMIMKNDIEKLFGCKFYVYEFTVNIKDVAVGSHPMIKEYTIDKEIKPDVINEFVSNESLILNNSIISTEEEIVKYKNDFINNKIEVNRSFALSKILDKNRDLKRFRIVKDIHNGIINVGDSLERYKEYINE